MLNYPFVYASAKANAPDVFKQLGFAIYPTVVDGQAPAGRRSAGFNLGVSAFSDNNDLAFEATKPASAVQRAS